MTKAEIFKLAHKEAKVLVAKKRISYAEAFSIGLRRAHNENMHGRMVLAVVATPKFMFLTGM